MIRTIETSTAKVIHEAFVVSDDCELIDCPNEHRGQIAIALLIRDIDSNFATYPFAMSTRVCVNI
ncbi:hypothetical protein D3C85_1477280 [compost metagenome]